MEWYALLLIICGGLFLFMCMGMPIVFAFWTTNILVYFIVAGPAGLDQLVLSIYDSITIFTILPILMFVFMGEMMFKSGLSSKMLDALSSLLGRVPGRLSLLAVMGGTVFASLSGSTVGSTAMLGSSLVPEMVKKGYKKPMILGPIMASGGLAMLIPPSGLGVLCAVVAEVSIGRMLLGIIMPGVITAAVIAIYIIVRCWVRPELAPAYIVDKRPLLERLWLNVRYVLPLSSIIIAVLGLIYFGVATPSQAAALGTVASFILATIYKGMNLQKFKEAVAGTISIAAMLCLILTGAGAFGQILAFSGIGRGLGEMVVSLSLPPIFIIIAMQLLIVILGLWMEESSMVMIILPIYMPIVRSLGVDPLWFTILMIVNIEIALISPPFGMILFTLKAVTPDDFTLKDIFNAAWSFMGIEVLVLILMMIFPQIVLWIPNSAR